MEKNKTWGDRIASENEFINQIALKFTHDPYTAQDLAQDATLIALLNEKNFDGHNLKGWLWSVVKNTFINAYRREKKLPVIGELTDMLQDAGLLQNSTSNAAPANLTEADLRAAIGRLNPAIQPVVLARMEGYKYEEIAEVTKTQIGTVRSRLFQARKLLPPKTNF